MTRKGRATGDPDLECAGFRVRWVPCALGDRPRAGDPPAALDVPAGGDYGAVRFAVLTEHSEDEDYAPDNRRDVTGCIPRG